VSGRHWNGTWSCRCSELNDGRSSDSPGRHETRTHRAAPRVTTPRVLLPTPATVRTVRRSDRQLSTKETPENAQMQQPVCLSVCSRSSVTDSVFAAYSMVAHKCQPLSKDQGPNLQNILRFIVRSTCDSDLESAKISFRNIVS